MAGDVKARWCWHKELAKLEMDDRYSCRGEDGVDRDAIPQYSVGKDMDDGMAYSTGHRERHGARMSGMWGT